MEKFFLNLIVDPSIGLGDEILATKNILFKAATISKIHTENIFYHLIDPVYQKLQPEISIDDEEFKEYYAKELDDDDLVEINYSIKTKNRQITKKIACLTTVKKNFQHTHFLCNLIHPDRDKFEVIIIEKNIASTFTIQNYKDRNIKDDIINDIFLLHKIFHSTKNFYKDLLVNNIQCNLKENDLQDLLNHSIPQQNILSSNFYNTSLAHFIPFQKKQTESKISIIEWWNAYSEPYDKLDFWKYKSPIKDIKTFGDYIEQFTNPAYYVYLNIFKYGFNTSAKTFYENNIDNPWLAIDFINYKNINRSELQPLEETFNKILSSKFCIGTEGGYAHLSLYADIPYLMVIPDVAVTNDSKMLLDKLYKAILSRYSLRNLFFCTESDLIRDDLISIMNTRVDFLQFEGHGSIDWGYRCLSTNMLLATSFSKLQQLHGL